MRSIIFEVASQVRLTRVHEHSWGNLRTALPRIKVRCVNSICEFFPILRTYRKREYPNCESARRMVSLGLSFATSRKRLEYIRESSERACTYLRASDPR